MYVHAQGLPFSNLSDDTNEPGVDVERYQQAMQSIQQSKQELEIAMPQVLQNIGLSTIVLGGLIYYFFIRR